MRTLTKSSSIFLLLVLVAGCATEPTYEERLKAREKPDTQQEVMEECGWIRDEVARMQSTSAASATSQFALALQAKARRNIAALENRAADIGCRAAFSSQTTSAPKASNIEQCIEACKKNTDRSSEACFDSCNR